jgi:hypothetical protein
MKNSARQGSVEGLGEAGLGRGDGVVDAAAVAVAGDGAVGVPALAARLRRAADAEALAAVVVGQAGEDLLGGELRDLVCGGGGGEADAQLAARTISGAAQSLAAPHKSARYRIGCISEGCTVVLEDKRSRRERIVIPGKRSLLHSECGETDSALEHGFGGERWRYGMEGGRKAGGMNGTRRSEYG